MSAPDLKETPDPGWHGFLLGLRAGAGSVFVFVVSVTYVGFGALVHDYGLSVWWAVLSTLLIWAAPAQVILATAVGSGAALIEGGLTVGLSSVRLLPMVVALLPLVKDERTRPWQLVVPAHFTAISMWVEAMRLSPSVPRPQRIPYCNGIGVVLVGTAVIASVAGFYLSAWLPVVFGAVAMFITPLSFLISTARNSRLLLEKAALVLGLAIAPLLAYGKIQLDLLWTGLIGGTLAYLIARWRRDAS